MATTTTTSGNFLEKLPPELILKILPQLPELASLDSVIRASPICYRVFESYAAEITDAVLSCGGLPRANGKYFTTGYTCGHIRVLICVIARIRSAALSIHSWKEFDERVISEALRYRSRVRPSRLGFAPERLDRNTPPAVLRSILATSRRLTWCTLDCLEFHFSQVPPSCANMDIKPPSWQEEQRVMRIFWRLQLLVDLQAAASADRLPGWPAADIDMLKTKDLDPESVYHIHKNYESQDMWFGVTLGPEYHELLTVTAYVCERFHDSKDEWWPPAAAVRDVEVSRKWPIPVPRENDWRLIIYPAPDRFLTNRRDDYTGVNRWHIIK